MPDAHIFMADALSADILLSRAVICVSSTILQMAAEKYLRPRPIEVAASGPHTSASAFRSSRCNRI